MGKIKDIFTLLAAVVLATNGAPLSPAADEQDCTELDLVLMLDADFPTSETPDYLSFLIEAVQSLAGSYDQTRVALITFSDTAVTQFQLDSYSTIPEITQAISDVSIGDHQGQGTDIYEGLHAMRGEFLKRKHATAKKVALLVTNGGDSDNHDNWQAIIESQAAKVERIELFMVGVGSGVRKQDALWMVADKNHVEITQSSSQLSSTNTLRNIRDILCPVTIIRDSWTCSFEEETSPLCGMMQDVGDDFDWTRYSGTTPSFFTGPLEAQDGDYYIYIEATRKDEDDQAIIHFPQWKVDGYVCVNFYYNMYGFHINELELMVKSMDTESTAVMWNMNGEQGTSMDWYAAQVEVRLDADQWLAFVATRGEEYSGDIAVDNISVNFNRCT